MSMKPNMEETPVTFRTVELADVPLPARGNQRVSKWHAVMAELLALPAAQALEIPVGGRVAANLACSGLRQAAKVHRRVVRTTRSKGTAEVLYVWLEPRGDVDGPVCPSCSTPLTASECHRKLTYCTACRQQIWDGLRAEHAEHEVQA